MGTARQLILVTLLTGAVGCVQDRAQLEAGIQPAYRAYVPSLVVIAATQDASPWSGGSLPQGAEVLLAAADQFVAGGFDKQKYMQGIAPRTAAELLRRNEKIADPEAFWSQLSTLWSSSLRRRLATESCDQLPYWLEVEMRFDPSWQAWLHTLSEATHYSVAILIPVLWGVDEGTFEHRHGLGAFRRAKLSLLLIDTNSARVIWTGGHAAYAEKTLPLGQAGKPEFPSWEVVAARLLTAVLWHEYPGRVIVGSS